jgi:hypothetical protein
MVSYGMGTSPTTSKHRPGAGCIYTIAKVTTLLCVLDATSKACDELVVANTRQHSKNVTKEVEQGMQVKYGKDLELWKDLLLHAWG